MLLALTGIPEEPSPFGTHLRDHLGTPHSRFPSSAQGQNKGSLMVVWFYVTVASDRFHGLYGTLQRLGTK